MEWNVYSLDIKHKSLLLAFMHDLLFYFQIIMSVLQTTEVARKDASIMLEVTDVIVDQYSPCSLINDLVLVIPFLSYYLIICAQIPIHFPSILSSHGRRNRGAGGHVASPFLKFASKIPFLSYYLIICAQIPIHPLSILSSHGVGTEGLGDTEPHLFSNSHLKYPFSVII